MPIKKAVGVISRDAAAHSNLGLILKELGRLNEAEASLRQAITLKTDFSGAHYNLGNILKEQERLDEAEASYRQAVALKPDYAEAHTNLGRTLLKMGRHHEGLEEEIIGDGVIRFDLEDGYSVS